MSNAAASLAGQDPGHTAERVKVPLLVELLSREVGDRRRVWADLGSAQSGLVQRLTGGHNRLIVADLPGALEGGDANWHRPDKVLDEKFWAEPIDCFLCWDLLNYMHPEQLGDLLRALWGYEGTPTVSAALKLAPLFFLRPGDLRGERETVPRAHPPEPFGGRASV